MGQHGFHAKIYCPETLCVFLVPACSVTAPLPHCTKMLAVDVCRGAVGLSIKISDSANEYT